MKGITPKMCRLCVYVIINKRSFEPFMCLSPVPVFSRGIPVYTINDTILSTTTHGTEYKKTRLYAYCESVTIVSPAVSPLIPLLQQIVII